MSDRRARGVACLAAVGLALGLTAGVAHATYLAPQILSSSATQEFDDAGSPALAADGEWVAFQGSLRGVPGIYRRNLQTGEVDLVSASGTNPQGGTVLAEGPSISADGRDVAFTSNAVLDPAQEPAVDYSPATGTGCPEVYVRDMDTGAVTLASALNGTSTGITFSGCGTGAPTPLGGLPVTGAQATAGVSISDDGSEVAFTVVSSSDLGGTPGVTATPPSQVAVRDLANDSTTVATVGAPGEPNAGQPVDAVSGRECDTRSGYFEPCPAGGGAYPSGTSELLGGGSSGAQSDAAAGVSEPASTATISGDGTTVAWMGTNVPSQVPGATDVVPGMEQDAYLRTSQDPAGQEVEPLWRRIADESTASTQRLLASSGLAFYSYFGFDSENGGENPIEGGSAEGIDPGAIALSDNGEIAVLTADAPAQAALANLAQSGEDGVLPGNAYVVSVADAPGVTPAVTPLTAITNYGQTGAATADIPAIAVSPDGTQVALETARTEFELPSPALITAPTEYSGTVETYEADLTTGTLELATSTYNGQSPNGSSGYLSFDGAEDLAFASRASNLFYGDVNTLNPEVYLLPNLPTSTAVASGSISAPAAGVSPAPAWTASVTATPFRDGVLVVYASVPGAGGLSARAAAQLPHGAVASVSRPRAARQTHEKPTHHKRTPTHPPGTPLKSSTVATAHASSSGAGIVMLRLRVTRRYRPLTQVGRGLYATVTVTFTAAGHAPLTETIPVSFRDHVRARHHQHRRSRKRSGSGR